MSDEWIFGLIYTKGIFFSSNLGEMDFPLAEFGKPSIKKISFLAALSTPIPFFLALTDMSKNFSLF